MKNHALSLLIAASLGLAGVVYTAPADAQRYRGYDRDYERNICDYCGTVRSISRVSDRGRRHNNGAIILGAVIGGALGNQVGSGDGRRAATVVGAIAGGAIANNASRDRDYGRDHDYDRGRRGGSHFRISVRMDGGRMHDFYQYRAYGLRAGSRVEIVDGEVLRLR